MVTMTRPLLHPAFGAAQPSRRPAADNSDGSEGRTPVSGSSTDGLTPGTHMHDFATRKPGADRNGIQNMDIKPLMDMGDIFRIDADYDTQVAQKKVLLQNHADAVSATAPEGAAGARELLEVMAEYLPEHFPDKFEKNGRILTNKATGDVFDLDNLPADPIAVAGMLVQEDLILIHEGEDGQFRLSAGSLSFPSGWSLKEKLGKTVAEIHDGVPEVNKHIGEMMNKFLARIKPDRSFWRINFLSFNTPVLTTHPDIPELEPEADFDEVTKRNVGKWYLRSEREVFTRVPQSGDILFSLKTYVTQFKDLAPGVAGQLSELYANLPARFVKMYKGWTKEQQQIVVDYMARKAKQKPAAS